MYKKKNSGHILLSLKALKATFSLIMALRIIFLDSKHQYAIDINKEQKFTTCCFQCLELTTDNNCS